MYTLKGTVGYPFCLVWSSISSFSNENVSDKEPIRTIAKITTIPRLVSEHPLQDENKYQIVNVHNKRNCLIPILSIAWSSISSFSNEIVCHKEPIRTSGKITTVPRLFSEHSLQDENKHQIMNIHTKKNCFILILSTLVKY